MIRPSLPDDGALVGALTLPVINLSDPTLTCLACGRAKTELQVVIAIPQTGRRSALGLHRRCYQRAADDTLRIWTVYGARPSGRRERVFGFGLTRENADWAAQLLNEVYGDRPQPTRYEAGLLRQAEGSAA